MGDAAEEDPGWEGRETCPQQRDIIIGLHGGSIKAFEKAEEH